MVVEWSDVAKDDLKQITRYLENNWSAKVVNKFARNMDKEVDRITLFPCAFPVVHRKKDVRSCDVRRCVVSKINSIYYSVKENTILILAIIDNRQSSSPYT
ncbi:hypothetical protein EZS27_028360 [termite gut metagenome]|uniref:Plasmid stabilization system protein n=1 Tax=termite gut metagenome TaxID=433724 RepID=A0A5J4QMA1_9ZZZZ